jgi:hypothetical protein
VVPGGVRVAVATRPCAGETANGDGWLVQGEAERWQIALIDGLGHGPLAAEAAEAAKDALRRSVELPIIDALHACHQVLRGLRGAAVSVARLDLAATRLTYAGVGNVEARLRQDAREQRLIAYRGVVGAAMPRLQAFDFILEPDWLLLLHTDGISTRLDLSQLIPEVGTDLEALADAVLAQWGRPNDDASVIIAGAPLDT